MCENFPGKEGLAEATKKGTCVKTSLVKKKAPRKRINVEKGEFRQEKFVGVFIKRH